MQSIFDVIAEVRAERVDALRAYLRSMKTAGGAFGTFGPLPFASVDALHFTSLVVVPAAPPGPPFLVFECNVDGTPEDYLRGLVTVGYAGLDEVFSSCVGYEAKSAPDALFAFLRARVVRPNAAFVANIGLRKTRIRDDAALRASIDALLDGPDAPPRTDAPPATYAAIRAHVAQTSPGYDAVDNRWPTLDTVARRAPAVGIVAGAVLLTFVMPLIVALVLIAYACVLRVKELRDPVDTASPDAAAILALALDEDQIVQNHLVTVSLVKPGRFRRLTLKGVLFAVDRVAKLSTHAKLGTLDNIHFAHWRLIDDDRRLLFMSNYDGTWENYLDDFIDVASFGLTAIWSNTRLFPRTAFLVLGGAKREAAFKARARGDQIASDFWYSAYPNLTVTQIEKNWRLRSGFASEPAGAELDAWLLSI